MPVNISANYTANFTNFYQAVDKAEIKLKEFGGAAETAGDRLQRLSDSFSGDKIIQSAILTAKAVERVGGISTLTEKELARVGSTVNEAAEKMRKLGLDVPANFKAIEDASKKADTSTKSWTASLSDAATLVKGFIALQAVQYVINFGREILAEADSLKKLSAQTSISTDWIQRFQIATDDAGGSVQDIGNAIFQLQKRLGENDKGTSAAIESLGLSVQHLRTLSPEQQFLAIAAGLKAIEDPARQAATGADIFGRSFQQILPVIKRGMDDIAASATVMSQETVDALDEMGDYFTRLGRSAHAAAGNLAAFVLEKGKVALGVREIDVVTAALEKQLAAQLKLTQAKGLPAGLPVIGGPTEQEVRDLDREIDRLIDTRKKDIDATIKQKKISDDYRASLIETEGAAVVYAGQIRANMKVYESAADQQAGLIAESERAAKQNADIGKKIRAMSAASIQADVTEQSQFFADTFAYLAKLPDEFMGPVNEAGKQFTKFGDYIASELPRTILAAVQGGGSVLKSTGTLIGQYLLDPKLSGVGESIQTAASKLPGLIGKAVGDFIPFVGGLIGPAIDGVKKLFGKMFGAEQKEVNKLREQFIEAAGGIDALRRAATEAGVTLDALMAERKKKGLQADIDALTEALAFQKTAMDEVKAAADRYGITLAELGPAMARGELDKQAQQLFKDFELLKSAGLEQVVITNRMSDAVNEYIKTAVAMGIEVDAAMKPMLQQFIDAGTLIDANGEAITNLEDSGISFSMTMSEGFKTLIDEVKKLTDAIARGLGLAIKNIPEPQVKGRVSWAVDPIPQSQGARAMESYQEGTGGFKNFGAGTPVMLHGWEAVVPRDETGGAFATVGAAGVPTPGAAAPVSIVIHAEGAFFDTPGDLQRLADKVSTALTAKYSVMSKLRAAV